MCEGIYIQHKFQLLLLPLLRRRLSQHPDSILPPPLTRFFFDIFLIKKVPPHLVLFIISELVCQ